VSPERRIFEKRSISTRKDVQNPELGKGSGVDRYLGGIVQKNHSEGTAEGAIASRFRVCGETERTRWIHEREFPRLDTGRKKKEEKKNG